MYKKYWFLLLLCGGSTRAQQQNIPFAQTVAVAAADSLISLAPVLKSQLQKATGSSEQPNRLRLFVTGSTKTTGSSISRWVAAKQQRDIYRVDLGTLVSKYIGETEKNLQLVFDRAEQKGQVLFFDEADALFGKRSAAAENNSTVTAFVKYCERFTGTVIIRCNNNNCAAPPVKLKCTVITAGQ